MYFDPNKTPVARALSAQVIQFIRATINYNDAGIAGGVAFAKIPQNAFIVGVWSHVITAFNAGTTNVASVGTSAAATEILATIPAALGFNANTAAAGLGMAVTQTGDVTVYAKYAQTGTAATAGQAVVVIGFLLNIDQ
jgi:hypothetical protein